MTELFKLSGAGNDFLALVELSEAPGPEQVRAWCRRRLSVGADGLFTLARTERGARMVHFNADGGRAELCLNGSRCAAQLAFHLGWHDRTLVLGTDAGDLAARRLDPGRVALELPSIVTEPVQRSLAAGGRTYDGWYLWAGVPHLVLPWSGSLGAAPVNEVGALLRRHPDLGADGANVDFVRFPERLRLDRHRFEIRSFERGVEAETLACGTGVVAAVVAGLKAGLADLPVTALTTGGFELVVDRADAGEGRLSLAGDARLVARAEVLPGASGLPAAAVWAS